jgi:anti-sigma factor RsiW
VRCAGALPLLGSRPGELDPTEEALLRAHLTTCATCRARQADVEALGSLVTDGLLAEAAGRDLAGLADGVLARIPASAWRGEPSGPLARARAFFQRHRVLAAASALAPALAALALYLYIGRGGGPGAAGLSVEVTSEDLAAIVLETNDGPVILVGEGPEGT